MNNLELAASVLSNNDLFMVIILMKFLIGILALGYMISFFLTWDKTKRNLSIISFYTLNKIVKKGIPLTIGLVFFLISFIVELAILFSFIPSEYYIFIALTQLVAIIFIGYTFYEILRKDIEGVSITDKKIKSTPIASYPSTVIREMNKKDGIYDEEYIKKKLEKTPIPEKLLKSNKTKKKMSRKKKTSKKRTTSRKKKTSKKRTTSRKKKSKNEPNKISKPKIKKKPVKSSKHKINKKNTKSKKPKPTKNGNKGSSKTKNKGPTKTKNKNSKKTNKPKNTKKPKKRK